jgi:hypothetical protein
MKTAVLFSIALLSVTTAGAQTSAPATADQSKESVTLSGCVTGGSGLNPVTLTQALLLPGTHEPGQVDQTPSLIPPSVSAGATQQASSEAAVPSPVGTSGSKTSSPISTSGVASGTAPAGSSGASLSGYRLSGVDMTPWLGQRVLLLGTFVPAAPQAAPSATITGATAAPPLLEFKVSGVKQTSGSCPK